jgi:hypothetical protein
MATEISPSIDDFPIQTHMFDYRRYLFLQTWNNETENWFFLASSHDGGCMVTPQNRRSSIVNPVIYIFYSIKPRCLNPTPMAFLWDGNVGFPKQIETNAFPGWL